MQDFSHQQYPPINELLSRWCSFSPKICDRSLEGKPTSHQKKQKTKTHKKKTAPGPPSPKWFTIGANILETYRTSLTYSKIICQIALRWNHWEEFCVTKKGVFCGGGREERWGKIVMEYLLASKWADTSCNLWYWALVDCWTCWSIHFIPVVVQVMNGDVPQTVAHINLRSALQTSKQKGTQMIHFLP